MVNAASLVRTEEQPAPSGMQRQVFQSPSGHSPAGFWRQQSEPKKVHTINRQLSWYSTEAMDLSERDDSSEVDASPEGSSGDLPGGKSGDMQDSILGLAFQSTSERSPALAQTPLFRPPPGLEHPQARQEAPTRAGRSVGVLNVPRLYTKQARQEAPTRAGRSAGVLNVPRLYTKQMLLEEIKDAGFCQGRDFDTLHMLSRQPGCFINFTSISAKNAFMSAFHGRMMRYSSPEDGSATGRSAEAIFQAVSFCPQCGSFGVSFCVACGTELPRSRNATTCEAGTRTGSPA